MKITSGPSPATSTLKRVGVYANSCARAGRGPPNPSASSVSSHSASWVGAGRPARAAGELRVLIDVLLCQRSVAQKNLFDRQFEQVGDAEGERQRGSVLARLHRIAALPRSSEMVGQVLLAPLTFRAQHAEAVLHRPVALSQAFAMSRATAKAGTASQPAACGTSLKSSSVPHTVASASTAAAPINAELMAR